MNKNKLSRFIQKYNLGGNINSVKWDVKNNVLFTSFVTTDRKLLGSVKLNDFKFDNSQFGVNDTSQLNKLLNIIGDDMSMSLTKFKDKAISLNVENGAVSFDYPLADLSVINDPPKLKQIPTFETKIKIDEKFIDIFIKGKSALQDADTFTVVKGVDLKSVIGHSNINTNRVNIPMLVVENGLNKNIIFDANLFKEILISNKECTSAIFEISNEGLGKITFNIDDYECVYYLVSDQGNS